MCKASVLIVDDIDINLEILEEILKDDYDTVTASSGLVALDLLFNAEVFPKVILLDIRMPIMDGYQVLEVLKSNDLFKNIPVIFITAENAEIAALAAGAADYISKPFHPDIVRLRVANQMRLKQYTESLEELLKKKTEEISATQGRVLEAMAGIIEYRNMETGSHIMRVSDMTMALINYLLSNSNYAEQLLAMDPPVIVKSVPMHDVGKIGIPDNILLKPGRLTQEEFEVIKTHTTIGKNIVESVLANEESLYLQHCRDICYCHHERYDGRGYPMGIAGQNIPLSARLVSVVDVYDALTSRRVYKPPFSHDESIEMIKEGSGTQFDPVVVEAAVECEDVFRQISEEN